MSGNELGSVELVQELQQLSQAIRHIVDDFREISRPLQESREQVPQATRQLDRIAEQTEAAAHRVIDKVETILAGEETIINGLDEIKTAVAGEDLGQVSSVIERIAGQAQANLDDTYEILDALQFQDITAQQVNHAAAVLEQVETTLSRIGRAMTGEEGKSSEQQNTPKKRVFDPHANMQEHHTDQDAIDALVSQSNAHK